MGLFGRSASAIPELPIFRGGSREAVLAVRRMAQARRMRLSVDPRDGGVRLVLPKRAALKPALVWVEGQRAWIEQQLATLPAIARIEAGGAIPFEGRSLPIRWDEAGPRTPRLDEDALVIGGDPALVHGRVLRWLKARALAHLDAETRSVAAQAGVSIGSVAIGDPRTRWGSCSSGGDIRYSWRLILAPPAVLRATVAHEVAHRLHMDHGREFHAAVARLLGHQPDAEIAWLRTNGSSLYWLG